MFFEPTTKSITAVGTGVSGTETMEERVKEERLLKEVPESDLKGSWGLASLPFSVFTLGHALCWTLRTQSMTLPCCGA